MNAEIVFSDYLYSDNEKGIHKIDRRVFTDPEIFEMEMKYIFERNWIYLCHESQIKNPNDYYTTFMGRQPVIVTRDRDGAIHGFINACSHRGAQLVNLEKGNKKVLMCPFHGWCFDTKGTLLDCGNNEKAGYSDDFNPAELNLKSIGKIESYRGFVFGSLSEDVATLADFLAESKHLIDMFVDQSDQGLEVLPGTTKYTYDGNWKLQAENGVDGYHVESIHANYVMTIQNRKKLMADKDTIKAAAIGNIKDLPGGYYDLGQGHVLLWQEFPNLHDRPLAEKFDELKEKYGELRAKWMAGYLRNLCLYPNVFIMDQMSSQIRHFRPIAVDKTEVTTFCIAPVGESDQARERRIRQYEDFFNATGMATPDDLTAFNNTQIGFRGERSRWSDMSRGFKNIVQGPEVFAKELGISPVTSGTNLEDEGLMVAQHKHWSDLMTQKQNEETKDAS